MACTVLDIGRIFAPCSGVTRIRSWPGGGYVVSVMPACFTALCMASLARFRPGDAELRSLMVLWGVVRLRRVAVGLQTGRR